MKLFNRLFFILTFKVIFILAIIQSKFINNNKHKGNKRRNFTDDKIYNCIFKQTNIVNNEIQEEDWKISPIGEDFELILSNKYLKIKSEDLILLKVNYNEILLNTPSFSFGLNSTNKNNLKCFEFSYYPNKSLYFHDGVLKIVIICPYLKSFKNDKILIEVGKEIFKNRKNWHKYIFSKYDFLEGKNKNDENIRALGKGALIQFKNLKKDSKQVIEELDNQYSIYEKTSNSTNSTNLIHHQINYPNITNILDKNKNNSIYDQNYFSDEHLKALLKTKKNHLEGDSIKIEEIEKKPEDSFFNETFHQKLFENFDDVSFSNVKNENFLQIKAKKLKKRKNRNLNFRFKSRSKSKFKNLKKVSTEQEIIYPNSVHQVPVSLPTINSINILPVEAHQINTLTQTLPYLTTNPLNSISNVDKSPFGLKLSTTSKYIECSLKEGILNLVKSNIHTLHGLINPLNPFINSVTALPNMAFPVKVLLNRDILKIMINESQELMTILLRDVRATQIDPLNRRCFRIILISGVVLTLCEIEEIGCGRVNTLSNINESTYQNYIEGSVNNFNNLSGGLSNNNGFLNTCSQDWIDTIIKFKVTCDSEYNYIPNSFSKNSQHENNNSHISNKQSKIIKDINSSIEEEEKTKISYSSNSNSFHDEKLSNNSSNIKNIKSSKINDDEADQDSDSEEEEQKQKHTNNKSNKIKKHSVVKNEAYKKKLDKEVQKQLSVVLNSINFKKKKRMAHQTNNKALEEKLDNFLIKADNILLKINEIKQMKKNISNVDSQNQNKIIEFENLNGNKSKIKNFNNNDFSLGQNDDFIDKQISDLIENENKKINNLKKELELMCSEEESEDSINSITSKTKPNNKQALIKKKSQIETNKYEQNDKEVQDLINNTISKVLSNEKINDIDEDNELKYQNKSKNIKKNTSKPNHKIQIIQDKEDDDVFEKEGKDNFGIDDLLDSVKTKKLKMDGDNKDDIEDYEKLNKSIEDINVKKKRSRSNGIDNNNNKANRYQNDDNEDCDDDDNNNPSSYTSNNLNNKDQFNQNGSNNQADNFQANTKYLGKCFTKEYEKMLNYYKYNIVVKELKKIALTSDSFCHLCCDNELHLEKDLSRRCCKQKCDVESLKTLNSAYECVEFLSDLKRENNFISVSNPIQDPQDKINFNQEATEIPRHKNLLSRRNRLSLFPKHIK